jgi:hypothetical protein
MDKISTEPEKPARSEGPEDWEGLRQDLIALGHPDPYNFRFVALKEWFLNHLKMREQGGGEHRKKLVGKPGGKP